MFFCDPTYLPTLLKGVKESLRPHTCGRRAVPRVAGAAPIIRPPGPKPKTQVRAGAKKPRKPMLPPPGAGSPLLIRMSNALGAAGEYSAQSAQERQRGKGS